MLTWVYLWWICLIPLPLVFVVGALPSIPVFGQVIQGGVVREWFLNHLALPLLTDEAGWILVNWFDQASYGEELIFQLVIAVDVTLLLLPVMYVIGEIFIRLSAWAQTTSHEQRRRSIR